MAEEPGQFFYVACQAGAERVCKAQMALARPTARFSFSRPGFLTYKVNAQETLSEDLQLRNAFARSAGVCLGRVSGANPAELADHFWREADQQACARLHVWSRLPQLTGDLAEGAPANPLPHQPAVEALEASKPDALKKLSINTLAAAGDRVLECILVEENQWWIAAHVASSAPSRWPGGVPLLKPPAAAISRAYYKMHEALMWSKLPIRTGDVCFEIGSAPGGAAQALLERGLQVVGIDPAEMDERVSQHESFTHIRKRGRDVRRREFASAQWLMVDSNVTPQQTLDTVGEIVTHEAVKIRGMLLTLKFPKWDAADQLPDHLERIRSWGFQHVRPRHLAYNRQEVCVAAFKNRAMRRFR